MRCLMRVFSLLRNAALACAVGASPAPASEIEAVLDSGQGGPPAELRIVPSGDGGHRAIALWSPGVQREVILGADGARLVPPKYPLTPQPFEVSPALPFARPAFGANEIREAWLAAPTRRYRHGVLGDDIEAAAILVRIGPGTAPLPPKGARELNESLEVPGAMTAIRLPADSVFEANRVVIADVDGTGRDAILATRSYIDRGAALVVIRMAREGLAIVAETPAIGTPNRWLNPIGAADLDGDGRKEILLVATPHLDGRLQVWRLTRSRLEKVAERAGYTNHRLGSPEQDLAAIADLDADGRPSLVIPSLDARSLAVVALRGDRLVERARLALPGDVAAAVRAIATSRGMRVITGLSDGRILVIRP